MSRRAGFVLVNVITIGVSTILVAAVTHGSGALDSARTARVIDDIWTLRSAGETWAKARGTTSYAGPTVAGLNPSQVPTKRRLSAP